MKIVNAIVSAAGLLLLVSLVAFGQMSMTAATDGLKAEAVVDADGNLRVPADYRTTYQLPGNWAVAADEGDGSRELHVDPGNPLWGDGWAGRGSLPPYTGLLPSPAAP